MGKEELNQSEHDVDAEELDEFKASLGDPSELPDPKTKKTTEKPTNKKEPMQKLPGTKTGMMNAVVKEMATMTKEELKIAYGRVFNEELYDEDESAVEVAVNRLVKLTAADIDISDDVDAMFNGSDLDEEFKDRIRTIFEAAVLAKINEQIEKIAIDAESDVELSTADAVDELSEKVDSYLDYVVSEWTEENKLSIESGIRADMVESFMYGLKNLFTEHYVDIPENSVDIVDELLVRVEALESDLNEETDKNVSLLAQLNSYEKEMLFAESVGGLTNLQAEKLRSLTEGVDYNSARDFTKKISMLKSHYFDIDEDVTNHSVILDDSFDPISLDEDVRSHGAAMDGYAAAISRTSKK